MLLGLTWTGNGGLVVAGMEGVLEGRLTAGNTSEPWPDEDARCTGFNCGVVRVSSGGFSDGRLRKQSSTSVPEDSFADVLTSQLPRKTACPWVELSREPKPLINVPCPWVEPSREGMWRCWP